MFSSRDVAGLGKRVGNLSLEATNLSFILALHYLCLKQLTEVASSFLSPQAKETDPMYNNSYCLLSTARHLLRDDDLTKVRLMATE